MTVRVVRGDDGGEELDVRVDPPDPELEARVLDALRAAWPENPCLVVAEYLHVRGWAVEEPCSDDELRAGAEGPR